MTKLSRRQTIKLAAGAAVIGPSVLFSNTADAAASNVLQKRGLSAGNFAVKIAGIYDAVPGVIKVRLGSMEYKPDASGPQFGMLKIALATESDAPDLTINFAEAKLKLPDSALKISISLFAEEGKRPAITFYAKNAVPDSTSLNKAGNRWLNFAVNGFETITHKFPRNRNSALIELPTNNLKIQIGSLKFAGVQKVQKYSYDLKTAQVVESEMDWVTSSIAWRESTKVKPSRLKYSDIDIKTAERVSVTSYVISLDETQWKQWKQFSPKFKRTTATLKISMGDGERKVTKRPPVPHDGGNDTAQDIHSINFGKAQLTSIEFPRLEVGSTAPVTQTFHFTVEPGTD